VLDEGLL